MDTARAQGNSLTEAQRRAVRARGNVLVMAGAGTGKTKTLVERCLDCLERDSAMIDELLIVTFTEAAAAEMRDRLRNALENRAQSEPLSLQPLTAPTRRAEAQRRRERSEGGWTEQLARFELAHIGTLHSFCLKLVREHFYELDLDPRLSVLDEGEARQLANETADEQFAAHYAGGDEFSLAVQNLVQIHGGGRDESIRKLVLQLHNYSQARPDAAGWLAQQREKFTSPEPADWQRWLPDAISDWRDEWLPALENLKPENPKAAELEAILSRLRNNCSREAAADALGQIAAADLTASYPKGMAGKLRAALGDIFKEAQFLQSLVTVNGRNDPLVEDWSWVRDHMETLVRLAEEFGLILADRKRANGVLDFHDLEQFALKLLWDFSAGKPTAVAANWRAKLKFVFVDEYQDINAAQDKIIQGLSREGVEANRFLVGDVKQSIYRFRLADPRIFRDYARHWRDAAGETIPLSENFRSREGLLKLVNSLFSLLMREEIGGVAYDANAELKFGSRQTSAALTVAKDATLRAELLLCFKNNRHEIRDDEGGQAGLDDTQREARLVAQRVQQLVAGQYKILDADQNLFRPVTWRDIAILLRSPRGRSEVFAKEFERARIPLAVAGGGFYQSAEILDLLSLLQLLDNPLQDVPCIAVLRSPLVGLSLDELAKIRLATRDVHFWTALTRSAECGVESAETRAKIARFLERFSRWRRLARLVSLSQCLEEVLAETLYADWLRAQPRGAQRAANVAGFLHLAQQFDQFQRQGLYRFLKFVEAQQEAEVEPEVPAVATEDAVRLMSIHQSKGLEFPVVVLADLAKQFNEQDLHDEIIFDEEFGLCPKVKPPHLGRRYPSLPHWLAQRRQKRELRGEELRLLYVALTRARDHLILAASITKKNWGEKWTQPQPQPLIAGKIAAAKSFADWLTLWFSSQTLDLKSAFEGKFEGEFDNLYWKIISDAEEEDENIPAHANRPYAKTDSPAPPSDGGEGRGEEAHKVQQIIPHLVHGEGTRASHIPNLAQELGLLQARLEWSYPFKPATLRKAKSSVTALRREAEELDDEAEIVFPPAELAAAPRRLARSSKLNAAEIGAAHHTFLQHFALEKADDLAAEAAQLVRENFLSADEQAALDLPALAAFWNSELGRKIRAYPQNVRRELPFTARFSPSELAQITGAEAAAGLEQEFVVVQGVADLVVLRPDELWLVDFKTDEVLARELPEKVKMYRPQLRLYASAQEKIFTRKVTLRALHFLALGKTVEV